MAINLYRRANPSISAGMKFGLNHRALTFNVAAFFILFVGYFLTTGTGLIESDVAKSAFRFVALLLFLGNVILGRTIKVKFGVALFALLLAASLSQSLVVANMMFLLLISASLNRLSGKETAVALLVPTAIVVLLHLVLLNTGHLVGQTMDIAERTRSTMGFTNANQASVIYLSLVILAVFAHLQFRAKESLTLVVISYVAAFVVFWFTDTRTAMFSLFILLMLQILDFLFHRRKAYRVSLFLFGVASPFLASATTYYLTTSANPALDVLLSLRPYFFAQFMSHATMPDLALGWPTLENYGVDNLFLMLLSGVGAMGYFLIILSISRRVIRMNPKFIPLVILLMIVSVFESFLLRPEIPVSAFFIHLLFSRQLQQPQQTRIKIR